MEQTNTTSILIILLITLIKSIKCSVGDNYPSYQLCQEECLIDNCDVNDRSTYLSHVQRKWFITSLWDCEENCAYECMWPMVRICVRNGWKIPQFKGKWPFIRWLGVQEPASTFFSVLNLVTTVHMYNEFFKTIRTKSAMYWIWTIHALVSINAWIWSILFHTRDVRFTELMDYVSAAALIYYTFYAFGYRIIIFQNLFARILFVCGCMYLFIQHNLELLFIRFDYKENLHSLLSLAIIIGAITLFWCFWNWNVIEHVKYAAIYISLLMLFSLLEIFDFAPVFWTFDAHSLWHLSTVPLPYFIYKFAIEDCHYLRRFINRSSNVVTIGRF